MTGESESCYLAAAQLRSEVCIMLAARLFTANFL